MSLSAMIVDDEPLARQYLRSILSQMEGIEIVGEAAESKSCLDQARDKSPDVVFLDIKMPRSSGMEIAKSLREMAKRPQIIFVTGYDEYAVDAFDLDAADYVTKPFDDGRVSRAIERARARIQADKSLPVTVSLPTEQAETPQRIALRTKEGLVLVDAADIYFARTNGRSMQVKTTQGTVNISTSIKDLEARLTPLGFFRANEGAVINLRYLKQVVLFRPRSHELLMGDPDETFIPLSRSRVRKLYKLLGEPLG